MPFLHRKYSHQEAARRALAILDSAEMPDLGDSSKLYPVVLTEPEINAIHSAFGFFRAATTTAVPNYWKHYGPTLENLSKRLAEFDD